MFIVQKLVERMTKGAVLRLTGLPSDGVAREDIQASLEVFAKVKWIDFEKGQTEVSNQQRQKNKAEFLKCSSASFLSSTSLPFLRAKEKSFGRYLR